MATLEELLNAALAQQIMSPEQQQQRIDAQVAANSPAVLRKYGNTMQQLMENLYARGLGSGSIGFQNGQFAPAQGGMGMSTYLAQQLNPLMAEQNESLARVRQQAIDDVQSAQRAAVGQAAEAVNAQQNRQTQSAIAAAAQKGQMARQKQNQLVSGLTGAAGGIGKLGLGMLMAKPGSAGSGQSVFGNLKDLYRSIAGPPAEQTPDLSNPNELAAVKDLGQQTTPTPEWNPSPDTGGGLAGDWSSTASYDVPSDFDFSPSDTGAFDSMGSGGIFDWANMLQGLPGVNNASLADLFPEYA